MVLAFGYGYYGYRMFLDLTMILVLTSAMLSIWVSGRVQSTFREYSSVRSRPDMTGAQATERLLNSQGIYDVTIRPVSGQLTDHYDPRNKALNLSESVHQSSLVSAIGVATHECGHAIQDNMGYAPLKLCGAFVPAANLGSSLTLPLILIGFFLGGGGSLLMQVGIQMFALAILFQVITLPVEFSASNRIVALLDQTGILAEEEAGRTGKVLSTAALTYMVAVAASVLRLLRLLILFGGRRDND